MNNKKITVIGGSGFIGSYLCRLLHINNIKFEILDLELSREYPQYTKIADVRDVQSLANAISGEIVVNLAAVHKDDVKDNFLYQETNVDGAKNIVKVCEENKITKIIFTSSVAVYGEVLSETNEGGIINPYSLYGASKSKAESIFKNWQYKNNTKLVIIRPTAVFGVGGKGNINKLIEHYASKRFLMIGNGGNKKSIAYVENLAKFLLHCLDIDRNLTIVNFIDLPNISVRELIQLIVRNSKRKHRFRLLALPNWTGTWLGFLGDALNAVGIKFPVTSDRIKKFYSNTIFEANFKEIPNYRPDYSVEAGIKKTMSELGF